MLAANPWPISWLLKQGHAIFYEKCFEDPKTGKIDEVDLVITHPILLDAFYEYFTVYLWDQLPSHEARSFLIEKLKKVEGVAETRPAGAPIRRR